MPAPPIETDRLVLRPYHPDDTDALHALFTHPAVRKYLLDDQIVPRAWVIEEIKKTRQSFVTQGFGQYAVHLKTKPNLIGFTGFRSFFDPPQVQLLYGLHPDYWGRGLATEMAQAMIRHGFEKVGFKEIIAATDPPNLASIEVMKKAGLHFWKEDFHDDMPTIHYRLQRAEWSPPPAQ